MKGTKVVFAALFLLATAASTTFAESIPYEFTTIDIPIPGSTTGSFPEDINDEGVILTNVRINNFSEAVLAKPVGHKNTKFKTSTFSCTGLRRYVSVVDQRQRTDCGLLYRFPKRTEQRIWLCDASEWRSYSFGFSRCGSYFGFRDKQQ
jgi:hypothetical protein